MSDHPYMRLWVSDYLADTMHLTTAEHGAYLLLLMSAWRSKDGTLPNDDAVLGQIVRNPKNWPKMKQRVLAFWNLTHEGRLYQNRLLSELNLVHSKSANAALAGKASALKRLGSDPTDVETTLNVNPTILEPEPEILINTRASYGTNNTNKLTPPKSVDTNSPKPAPAVVQTVSVPDDIATPVDASWKPTESTRADILKMGVDVDRELPPFRAWHAAKGTKMVSWDAAFISWCNRSPRTLGTSGGLARPVVAGRVSDPKEFDAWFRRAYAGRVAPNGVYYDENGQEAPKPAHVYRPKHHEERGPDAFDKWFREQYAGTVAPNGVRYDDDGEPVLGPQNVLPGAKK